MMDSRIRHGGTVSEFELSCESCGGTLALAAVPANDGEGTAGETRVVAECTGCGNQYDGGRTLENLYRPC
ncbi:hypothetical protein [Haloarchaeobius sp. DFWS5]|uniref:hypothetical protein n=1 Tax=Haloarchaeobius sp. DFWS5 TaxID=3446114 RepID=UPI003EBED561